MVGTFTISKLNRSVSKGMMQYSALSAYYQRDTNLDLWCRESRDNARFCADRELRQQVLLDHYALLDLQIAFAEFIDLLPLEDLKSLERLTALLKLYPEFAQKYIVREDGEGTTAPLLAAQSSLVAYALLSFGARPDAEHVPSGDVILLNEWKLVLPQEKDKHNFRRWWCRFRGDSRPFLQQAVNNGNLDDVMSLLPFTPAGVRFSPPSHGGENFYALMVNLLEQGVISTSFMMRALSVVAPSVMLFRLFICYGLSLERDMIAPEIPLITAVENWIADNGSEGEIQRIRQLVDNLLLVMQAGREQLLTRSAYLTMDYSALAYLNTRRLMPFWQHEDFWRQKYLRDYPHGTSTSETLPSRLRCLYQETRVRAYHNDEVFSFSYHEGRGFVTALLLCGYSGEFHGEHPAFPDLVLSIPVERSSFTTFCSTYGLHFASMRIDLPSIITALDDDLLELEGEGQNYQGCPLASKQYTMTFNAVIGHTALKAKVQFDHLDFLRGALVLCRYFNADADKAISNLQRIV